MTFSITMFVALLGFMNGLNMLLDGLVLNRTPHIRLYNEIKPSASQPVNRSPEFKAGYNFIQSVKSSGGRLEIYNSAAIIQSLYKDNRVFGVAPKITAPVLYNAGTIDITGNVSGIDVLAESRMFFFNDYVTKGVALDLKNISNSIILGIALTIGLLGLLFGFSLSILIDQIPFNTAALPTIKTYPVSYKPAYYTICPKYPSHY